MPVIVVYPGSHKESGKSIKTILEYLERPKPGHEEDIATLDNALEHLGKNERALGWDYINCYETNSKGEPCWAQMDWTRELFGTNDVVPGKSSVLTWEHYVISPDPSDNLTLEQLREYTVKLAKEFFGAYQCAICYHNDNDNQILHAHLVVNNVNLDSGGRLSSYRRAGTLKQIKDRAEVMAAERGWTPLRANMSYATRKELGTAAQRNRRTALEKRIVKERRYSWRDDIRNRLQSAYLLSRNEEEFISECKILGVNVSMSSSENRPKEYLYQLNDGTGHAIRGDTLGWDWKMGSIDRRHEYDRIHGIPEIPLDLRNAVNEAIEEMRSHGIEAQFLGFSDSGRISARDLTKMLHQALLYDIRSKSDFSDALKDPMTPHERDELRSAIATATALNCFQPYRSKRDGERTPPSKIAQQNLLAVEEALQQQEDQNTVEVAVDTQQTQRVTVERE